MIKAVQGLRNRQIAPLPHLRRPNPEIDFAASPVRLPTRLEPWPEREVRRCGVSAFGIGGTNAHVVLESTSTRRTGPGPNRRPSGIPVHPQRPQHRSLRLTATRCGGTTRDDWTGGSPTSATSNLSRGHHRRRVGLVVRDVSELRDGLAAILAGDHRQRPARRGATAGWKSCAPAGSRATTSCCGSSPSSTPARPADGQPVPCQFDETRAWARSPTTESRLFGAAGRSRSPAHRVTFVGGARRRRRGRSGGRAGDRTSDARPQPALPGVRLVSPSRPTDAPDGLGATTDQLLADEPTRRCSRSVSSETGRRRGRFDRRWTRTWSDISGWPRLMRRAAGLTLVVLTRNALAVGPGDRAVAENAALAGLVKTLISTRRSTSGWWMWTRPRR